jgi:GntR family transcriptional regulator, galactonate operon transcriptional repressor
MGSLIGVGLFISHQISTESFGVFLPRHKRVLDAVAVRASSEAEDAMGRLLTETYEFMVRHLLEPSQQGRHVPAAPQSKAI